MIAGFHVAGRSALERHGIQQYLAPSRPLTLFGAVADHLPNWFTSRFPADYHRRNFFVELPQQMLHVRPMGAGRRRPLVSDPERALLELLSDVGQRQPLQEAREIVEASYTLRVSVLQQLLRKCKSIKTVRLCLNLGRELDLPWVDEVDDGTLPTGSRSRWIRRSPDGLLVLKP